MLIADSPTTDGHVFDPRIWDDVARHAFITELLALRPKVLLLSSVSAGHRYALEMAELAREHAPHCLVVLGGRHADETVRYQHASGTADLSWSSTVEVIRDGRARPVVDFVVAGDGAPCWTCCYARSDSSPLPASATPPWRRSSTRSRSSPATTGRRRASAVSSASRRMKPCSSRYGGSA
ncbi:hypothetical protein H0E86_20315 [Streptomyces sp. SCSIO-PteL053]|nr:hypothetical protein H0E86_20315 [Streptomyces sp. SCSIO-PteL053]